jgi:hypothetical protein
MNFDTMNNIMEEIGQERVRQEELKSNGKFLWTCAVLGLSA